ncbi:MAG: response regulator [Candidatus Omnitrophica bacterium]|nr:response regulator [Candidatus Omnitrophota bacterium]MCB9766972.1 response regulator [Candidatus Omnitrophota bacterium]MCB9784606.1 response regulator [Candidatus Omnitrophota bacterium]
MTVEPCRDLPSSTIPSILVVEDEPSSARLILRAFERSGLPNPVEVVPDAESALGMLRSDGSNGRAEEFRMPGLILSDHRLPRCSGLELIGRIKSDPNTRDIPCILFSASANAEDVIEAYRAGANCFLVKPQRFAELKGLMLSVHRTFLAPASTRGGLND